MTEALAAARSQDEIFQIIQNAAFNVLKAIGGAILLLDDTGTSLTVAASQGLEGYESNIWHHGVYDLTTPAGEALTRHQALYFEQQSVLLEAYPQLRKRAADIPVASAVLPMFLDGQPLGLLIIDFQEPHDFPRVERRFLPILAAQCAVALGRVQLIREMEARVERITQDHAAAQVNVEVLTALGDALQSAQTPTEVATFTLSKLGPVLRAQSMLVVFLDGTHLLPPTFWGDTPQVIEDYMSRPGLQLHETPLLNRAMQEHHGFYLADYPSAPGMVAFFPSLAVGVEPIRFPSGMLGGFLVVWRPVLADGWPPTERELTRRAANTLGLALERAHQTKKLQEQHAELSLRTQTLEGFALLARDFALEHDPLLLVGRVQELILSLLPAGMSTYYELENDLWQLRSHRGVFRDPVLLQKLQGGLPRGSVLNIERPYESRRPYYQERFDPTTSTVATVEFTAVQTTAALPVMVSDTVYGVVVFGFYQPRSWSTSERAMVETAAQSLGIALERSITIHQLLEQRDRLDLKSRELQTSNEELEAFTYSASHDLRTPVRHVMGFAELTQKALEQTPNDKAQRYLEVVKQGALRMNALIDGMLLLSRSGRQALITQAVDLNDLAMQAKRDVRAEFGGHPVRWQIGDLPWVQGDRDMLQQVLTNLLSNAVKYSAKRERSDVKVWSEESLTEWTIHVQDNGVGFDPLYTDRLFGIFQRLHTERAFQGTGVGLATVKRIVQKHGGRVFAESQQGSGATFSFTLPKDPGG